MSLIESPYWIAAILAILISMSIYQGGNRAFYTLSIVSWLILLFTMLTTTRLISKATGLHPRIVSFSVAVCFSVFFLRLSASLLLSANLYLARHFRIPAQVSSLTYYVHVTQANVPHLGVFDRLRAEWGLVSNAASLIFLGWNQVEVHAKAKTQQEVDALQSRIADHLDGLTRFQRQLYPDTPTVFPNIDGNCYINAVVQALLSLDDAKDIFADAGETSRAMLELVELKQYHASTVSLDSLRKTLSEEHHMRPFGRKLGGSEEVFIAELIDRIPGLREATTMTVKDINGEDVQVNTLGMTGEIANVDVASFTENFPIYGNSVDEGWLAVTGVVSLPKVLIINSGLSGTFKSSTETIELRDRDSRITYKLKAVIQRSVSHAWAHVLDSRSGVWYNVDNVQASPIPFDSVLDFESLYLFYEMSSKEAAEYLDPPTPSQEMVRKAAVLDEAGVQVTLLFIRDLVQQNDIRYLSRIAEKQKASFLKRISRLNVPGVVALTCLQVPPAHWTRFTVPGKNIVAAILHAFLNLKYIRSYMHASDLEFSKILDAEGVFDIYDFLETLRNPDKSIPPSGYLEIFIQKFPGLKAQFIDSVESITESSDLLIFNNFQVLRGFELRAVLGPLKVCIRLPQGWVEINGLVSKNISFEDACFDGGLGIYERS